jgi:hypothetical protein
MGGLAITHHRHLPVISPARYTDGDGDLLMTKRTDRVAWAGEREADAVMDQGPTNSMHYVGLEIVRLKQDHPDDDLKSGDCGVIWGVYGIEPGPYFYEATFINEDGGSSDMMFDYEDVEEVRVEDVAQTPHPEWLLETVQIFRRFEEALRERGD